MRQNTFRGTDILVGNGFKKEKVIQSFFWRQNTNLTDGVEININKNIRKFMGR
jgi:hypothetical protein